MNQFQKLCQDAARKEATFNVAAYMDSLATGIELDIDEASTVATGFALQSVTATTSKFEG